jgi:tRNA G26 N,N-dimethylase Trm1
MTCPHCLAAQSSPIYGGYQSKCDGCQRRSIARGPLFWESAKHKRILPAYQRQLEKQFGDDWKAAHEQIKGMA